MACTLVLIASLGIVLLGLVLGSGGLIMALLSAGPQTLSLVTISSSFLALTTGLGLALGWHASRSLRGQPSEWFRPQRVGLWVFLFVLVVVAGQASLSLEGARFLLFPFLHVSAALLPITVILSAVGRSLDGAVRWREMIVQLASGAFLSTALAATLELVAIGALAIAAVTGVALQPGGLDLLITLQERLSDPALLQDPTLLMDVVSSPLLIAAGLLVFAGLIPLIEEAVKTLGVGLMSYRQPGLKRALLWGLAGGCGFALVEGLFNTAARLDAWAVVTTMRVGATLLHAFTGALMGIAWHRLRVQGRWVNALGLYVLSVGIHGLWNGLAVGVTALGLDALSIGSAEGSWPMGLAIAALMAILIGMTCAMAGGLVALTQYVKRHAAPDLAHDSMN